MLNHSEFPTLQPQEFSYGVKVLTENDLLPLLSHNRSETRGQIAGYLKNLTEIHQLGEKKSLLLPSLVSLSDIFQTSQQEIHEALTQLKKDGYDSFVPGLYGHISLFCR